MQLSEAAQESRQDVLIANHGTQSPDLPAGPLQSEQGRALARGELTGARRKQTPQPGEGLDAGYVFSEGQQPHLVVVPCRPSVAIEQNGGVEGVLVTGIVHVGADDGRDVKSAPYPPQGVGREIGGGFSRQGW